MHKLNCCSYHGFKSGCSQGKYCPVSFPDCDRHVAIAAGVVIVIWVVAIILGLL